jgi:hypothetical protein
LVLLDAAETKSRDQSAAFETGEAFEKRSRMHALFNAEIHARHLRRNTVTASKKGNEANMPPPLDTQRWHVSWITFRVRNIKEDGRVL